MRVTASPPRLLIQPLARGDAADANVPTAQDLLPDQRHHDRVIDVVVGRVAICDVLQREAPDEADDPGIARLEDSIGPLVHDPTFADKGFDDDFRGIEHGDLTWSRSQTVG